MLLTINENKKMKSQTNKIILKGVEYTQAEADEIYNELLNPVQNAPPNKPNFSVGKNPQFITDQNLYNEIIKYLDKTFSNHKSNLSGKLNFTDGVMKGSNPYIAVAVDMFLKKQNIKHRIATQRDLETKIQMFKDCYEDTGLALRSTKNPNKSSAEHLYNQIKKSNPKLKFPIFIELRDLELDSNLNFNLTSQSKYKTADCLNWEDGTHYSQIDDYGLPKVEDASSPRQIWTRKDGLAGVYLDGGLDFDPSSGNVFDSDGNGRVVLVPAEGGAP